MYNISKKLNNLRQKFYKKEVVLVRFDYGDSNNMVITSEHIRERLCGISELKEYLRDNLDNEINPQKNLWLTKGDFDSFRDLNYVYGKKIINFFLYTAGKIIINSLIHFEILNRMNPIKFSLLGDDVFIVFPVSWMNENDIKEILNHLKTSVEERFRKQFIVACLTNFEQLIKKMSHYQLLKLEQDLSDKGIVIDFIGRIKGNLVLIRTRKSCLNPQEALEKALYYIAKFLPFESEKEIGICLDWLFNSQTNCFDSIGNGFIYPVTISFGAVSKDYILTKIKSKKNSVVMEMMFAAVEQNLKISKKTGNCITINSNDINLEQDKIMRKMDQKKENDDQEKQRSTISAIREDKLKMVLYESMETGHDGTLIHLIPFYQAKDENKSIDQFKINQDESRGNQFGIGIKGVNLLFGNDAGDEIVRILGLVISQNTEILRKQKGKIYLSRFVDQFKIFLEDIFLSQEELINLVKKILREFNQKSKLINISYLMVSIVKSQPNQKADNFLHQLELTNLVSKKAKNIFSNCFLLIKEYTPEVEKEGKMIKEEEAYFAACKLRRKI